MHHKYIQVCKYQVLFFLKLQIPTENKPVLKKRKLSCPRQLNRQIRLVNTGEKNKQKKKTHFSRVDEVPK